MKSIIYTVSFVLITLFFVLPGSVLGQNYQQANEVVFVIKYTGFKKMDKVKFAQEFNNELEDAVKIYWHLDMTYKFLESKEAYKYARSTKGKAIVAEFERVFEPGTHRTETTFNFRDAKTRRILSLKLPAYGLQKVDFIYAVMHSQFMFQNVEKFKKPSKDLPRKYGHLLKEKTLLVAESSLSKKLSAEGLKKVYPHECKVVSDEELAAAIINKDENHLVLYRAAESGNVSNTVYAYWNIYQPDTGVVVTRHSGSDKGITKADIEVFIKRTSK